MKILMFAIPVFLTVFVLKAEDIEKSTDIKTVFESISCGATEQNACSGSNEGKPSFLKYVNDQFVKFGGKERSQSGEKAKVKNNKGGRAEVFTLAELKREQNIEAVELKKDQKKEIKDLRGNADSNNQSELRKSIVKLKERHGKAFQELRKKHKSERKEFKKKRPFKKSSKRRIRLKK